MGVPLFGTWVSPFSDTGVPLFSRKGGVGVPLFTLEDHAIFACDTAAIPAMDRNVSLLFEEFEKALHRLRCAADFFGQRLLRCEEDSGLGVDSLADNERELKGRLAVALELMIGLHLP